ncbi:MAG: ribonuclease HI [Candidatus Sericytochromatia bacterium]|nr:ribonuclease HI [Candidatus Tanganyikabacteria bacterium]
MAYHRGVLVEGYCDASCSGNPGPGAAAAILVAREGATVAREIEVVSDVTPQTTNQREELKGGILVLEQLKRPTRITITSDSRYLVDGMTKWMPAWIRKGWRTAGGDPVANLDLWHQLQALADRHEVTWQWVKGHAGHPYNERCDRLAVAAVRRFQQERRT